MIGSSRLVQTAALLAMVLPVGIGGSAHAQIIPPPQPVPGLPGVTFTLSDSPQNFRLTFNGGGAVPDFVEFDPASPNWHFEFDIGTALGRVAIFATIFHELHPPGERLDGTDGTTVTPSIVIQPGLPPPLDTQILAFRDTVDHPAAGGILHSDFYQASGRCIRAAGVACGLGVIPQWSATFTGQHRARIPEPGSLALLGAGLLGLIGIGRLARRKAL